MLTKNARPKEFDARIMAYVPGMRAKAAKYRKTREGRDDLVTDTIAYCLDHWQNFRADGGLHNWIMWQMRGVVKNNGAYDRVRKGVFVDSEFHIDTASTPPTQHQSAELSAALSHMTGRDGGVLLRRAMGDGLEEIGADLGISRERVRQLEERARVKVRRKMGMR